MNENFLIWIIQGLFGLVIWIGKIWVTDKLEEIDKRFRDSADDRREIRDAIEAVKREIESRREKVDRDIVTARETAARDVEHKVQDLWKSHSLLREELAKIQAEHNMQMRLFPRRKWDEGES